MTYSVAIIHGIFMNRHVMNPLAKRISNEGHETMAVTYNSFVLDHEKLFESLDEFFKGKDNTAIVAWSLGGLLSRAYIARGSVEARNLEKVITLGTPHTGSIAAKRIFGILPKKLRPRGTTHLLKRHSIWEYPIPLHSIAGCNPVGPFRLLAGKLSDGAVAINETKLGGMTSHEVHPNNHAGLIFSKTVASRVVSILTEDVKNTI